jgi:disulfide bond formation protein DsbB
MMAIDRRNIWLGAPLWLAGISAALLGGALLFQYVGGLAPCPLCHWQRYPHAAAIVFGLAAVATPAGARRATLVVFAAAALLTTAAIGGFHVGVEQKWWAGFDSCEAGTGKVDPSRLGDDVTIGPRCDAVAWSLFGISMAGYNAIISFAAGALGIFAATRQGRRFA